MTKRVYPYPPGSYTAAKGKKTGTEEFIRLMKKRFGFSNLGSWVVRPMNGHETILSVHATAAACDLGYGTSVKNRQKAVQACRWLAIPEHASKLGIVAIHDYMANPPRSWRCDREAWKTQPNGELGPGGRWLHIELSKESALWSAKQMRAAWLSLPKPL